MDKNIINCFGVNNNDSYMFLYYFHDDEPRYLAIGYFPTFL